MRYSLLSRFQGALLGSWVGELLSSGGDFRRVLSKATLTPPKPEDAQPARMLSDWSQIAACGSESLIRRGRLDLEDWVLYSGMTQPSLLLLKNTASSSEAAVATLPMALFFHDDEVKLQQQLLQAAAVWQHDFEASEGVLAVAYAIAFALKEKLDGATLIPRIIERLGTPQTPFAQQLERIQTLLEQGAGLDATLIQLRRDTQQANASLARSYTSIALAFYCFLNTPEDFRLCVDRAVRTGYQPQTTAALAGALSGVYNSIIGIPVGWRLAASRISTGVKSLQLADDLLSVWSGVYDISDIDCYPSVAVAAPHVIQPR